MDVSFDNGHGNQDNEATIDIGNTNRGRDVSFNVHDAIQNGNDASDRDDTEALELA
jgi:hypothetical protein